MSLHSREAKIFVALLISMTAGAIALMTLGNNPPSAGAFCLSRYYCLDPVEKAISSQAAQSPGRWNRIEVYYSGAKTGNVELLTALSGLPSPEDVNCHFVICDGLCGGNGQIQPTEKWQRQWSIIPGQTWYGDGQTIRICIIADSKTTPPTDFQVKRTEALVEGLSRKFDIRPESTRYPGDWR